MRAIRSLFTHRRRVARHVHVWDALHCVPEACSTCGRTRT